MNRRTIPSKPKNPAMKPRAFFTALLLGIVPLQAAPRFLFDFNGMAAGQNIMNQIDDSPNASGGWVGNQVSLEGWVTPCFGDELAE